MNFWNSLWIKIQCRQSIFLAPFSEIVPQFKTHPNSCQNPLILPWFTPRRWSRFAPLPKNLMTKEAATHKSTEVAGTFSSIWGCFLSSVLIGFLAFWLWPYPIMVTFMCPNAELTRVSIYVRVILNFSYLKTANFKTVQKIEWSRYCEDLEDLKFKISEGSDQNWSCPDSALLAVSV